MCIESATYQQGTNTRTVTETVFEQPLEVVADNTSTEEIQLDWMLRIPGGLPPSLDVYRNKVNWSVKVNVAVDSFPDDDSTFPILVTSEIVV